MAEHAQTAVPESPAASPQPESPPAPSGQSVDSLREIIDLIALIIAVYLVFDCFLAERFVIPTGSMAPTLMGRHKDLICDNCGYPFRVSANDEVFEDGNPRPGVLMRVCQCPNCRYVMDLLNTAGEARFPSYKGDRILVEKFGHKLGEPERWDVIVFKYPVFAHQNFIKRLVGLPGETVRIVHGDIYVRRPGEQEFAIARKPPSHLLAMLQMVYDNDYADAKMVAKGWVPRWQTAPDDVAFTASQDLKSFQVAGDPQESWIRYAHTVPSPEDWRKLTQGLPVTPQQLTIEDFNAYNMGATSERLQFNPYLSRWVGDLALQCEVTIESPEGELTLELVEAGYTFQCRFNVATGDVQLAHSGDASFQPKAATSVKGPGVHRLRFANIDDQLLLWVDDKLVEFDAPTEYASLSNTNPREADKTPVGIAARGWKGQIAHLQVLRDIYYLAGSGMRAGGSDNPNGEEFPLQADQFFMLGDNSAASLDARYWEDPRTFKPLNYVDRELLIGKALMIYWPHSLNEIPGTSIPFPFFPNFSRMGLVR